MYFCRQLKYSIKHEFFSKKYFLIILLSTLLIINYLIINLLFKLSFQFYFLKDEEEINAEFIPDWEERLNSINCEKIYQGNLNYILKNKIQIGDPLEEENLLMDCFSIKKRNQMENYWNKETTKEEKEFPLAFTRVVYKDYLLLEMELALHYTPQNWYCYVVDSKSSSLFYSRLQRLSKCFTNIIIAEKRFSVSKGGHNTSDAMIECANILVREERKWNYLINLQNHDIQAKTNAEMVRIFSLLDGANDIEIGEQSDYTVERIGYYLNNFIWSFDELKLFKNDSKNKEIFLPGNPFALNTLTLSKGYSAASLSRPFINFITKELNLKKILEQFNNAYYGVDEHLWQSLIMTEALDAPGGFSRKCYVLGYKTPYITRYALWLNNAENSTCFSGIIRHGVCVFGLEDLSYKYIFNLPHLFINKMMPQYDFGVIKCWHKKLKEKQKFNSERIMNLDFYKNWPQTIYNRMRRQYKRPLEISEIKCE
ncbi:hypothetical protein Mgra_00000611 [Meloidogyne graminicola]|uniref:Uncharacterized protein n=1 Tax=Meloidogyne graminicola TaxID=189291 RepID=A0A8T0A2U6_9BILA|nr:hypothetical protein Mgra_00000611 [Meloidogyne graminicola]